MSEPAAFNDGQLSRVAREKAALTRKMSFMGGHWLWKGETNYAETPIVRNGPDVVAAIDAVWAVWKRRNRDPRIKRTCDKPLCVHPDHWNIPPP